MSAPLDLSPSSWVTRFSSLIVPGGTVLDLAAGKGRHARYLAGLGYQVEAVDRDAEALASLEGFSGIAASKADLEGEGWPYFGRVFDAVVVTNYLYRPLMPQILSLLDHGGVLIYETFMVGNERLGKPENPAYLLRKGELLDLVSGRLQVVAFEQGQVACPRPAVIQRICATRGDVSSLFI
ncbi:MAG TPA: methyltransferase domain-containing protein [Rhodocyclaceae bacterium]|nr:methyltransferase domain-containing protein [Rhodocyclaceae bacterium]